MIDDTYTKNHNIPNTQNIIPNKLIINLYYMATINNDIQPTYCSYTVSKLLKSLGFDVESTTYYNTSQELIIPCEDHTDYYYCNNNYRSNHPRNELHNSISAPTQDIAVEWLRINFDVMIHIMPHRLKTTSFWSYTHKLKISLHNTPQQAIEVALLKILTTLNKSHD